MDSEQLRDFEKRCEVVYGGGSGTNLLEQLDSQRFLLRLQSSAQYLASLRYILEESSSQYALLFAAKGLLLVATNDWRNISSHQRIDMQRFILQRLSTHMDPNNFITKALIHALCRITKLGWISDPDLRNITEETIQFVNAGVPHAILGFRILTELVGEFEMARNYTGGRIDSDGRAAAEAFREHHGLTKAFSIAFESVRKAFQDQSTRENQWLLKESLTTLETCLSYDFVGTGYSENDDVVACLYIPVEWTKYIATATALKTFFHIYHSQWKLDNVDTTDEGSASLALQCIALLSATRRSVFDEQVRYDFLVALLEGCTQLMQEKTGLIQSEACLHHFCRLLSRMKSNFQLVELAKPPQYSHWLHSLCGFTEDVLKAWRSVSSRSVQYLIRLWGALVLPTPYLRMRDGLSSSKSGQPNYLTGLDIFVPRVVQVFVSTRADMCSAVALEQLGYDTSNQGNVNLGGGATGMDDDLLDDEGMLLEYLAPLSSLVRFRYSVSAEAIGELQVHALHARDNAINMIVSNGNMNEAMKMLTDAQARLAFLTYLLGSVIGGHVTRVSARVIENLEELNAELAALVFRMIVASQRAEDALVGMGQQPSNLIFSSSAGWQLELASLYFFRCFQTLYIESRAREDEMDKTRHQQLIEDNSGYLTLTSMTRRGAISNASPEDENPGSSMRSVSAVIGPRPSASLDVLNRGFLGMISRHPQMGRLTADSDDDDVVVPVASGNSASQHIVVDELSANEAAKREKMMNDEANARAAVMQQSIAARVGIPGGDRALLDVAMRRIFALLQYAQSVQGEDASSAPVLLVERALSVLYQLSVGVTIVHAGRTHTPKLMSSGRLLLESDVIQDLLNNPSATRFPLLREIKHGRARSFLMATLSKLLFTQIRYPLPVEPPPGMTQQDQAEDRFVLFMNPMTEVADGILDMASRGVDIRNNHEIKLAFVGLTRDLRGVISSAATAREYELVFAWLHPRRIQLLSLGTQLWNDSLEIMVPLLKLLAEIVHNRGSRIVFPPLSAGGLVLFREASKVLVSFCTPQLQALERKRQEQLTEKTKRDKMKDSVANVPNGVDNIRSFLGISEGAVGGGNSDPMSMQVLQEAVIAMGEELFKSNEKNDGNDVVAIDVGSNAVGPGITIDLEAIEQKCSRVCLITMSRLLNGRYAALGTFDLFGDSSLNDARRVTLELAVSGSPKHIMSFPKMARSLIVLLNQMSEKFILALVNVSSAHFARIMACLGEAILSGQTAISTPATATIEALAVFKCRAKAILVQEEIPHSEQDPLVRIRRILNPAHRTRGDATSSEEYHEAARLFQMHENAHPNLFPSMLALIMNQLFNPASSTQDVPNQWSIAKPVMPLVLCCPQEFEQQRLKFLNSLNSNREQRVRQAYDNLFSKLGPALSNPALYNMILASNDNFTKHLCTFCRDIQRD